MNENLAMRTKTFKSKRMLRLVSLTGVLLINYLPSVLACEGCKEPSNVAGDSGVGGISASFSWSVVFMLGVLGFLLTGMLFMIIRSCKQLAAQQSLASEPMAEPVRDTSSLQACLGGRQRRIDFESVPIPQAS